MHPCSVMLSLLMRALHSFFLSFPACLLAARRSPQSFSLLLTLPRTILERRVPRRASSASPPPATCAVRPAGDSAWWRWQRKRSWWRAPRTRPPRRRARERAAAARGEQTMPLAPCGWTSRALCGLQMCRLFRQLECFCFAHACLCVFDPSTSSVWRSRVQSARVRAPLLRASASPLHRSPLLPFTPPACGSAAPPPPAAASAPPAPARAAAAARQAAPA